MSDLTLHDYLTLATVLTAGAGCIAAVASIFALGIACSSAKRSAVNEEEQ